MIWITIEPTKLSRKATAALSQARLSGAGMGIASSTLWELAMTVSRGRIRPDMTLSAYLQLVEENFVVYPITSQIAEASMQFTDAYPKDPTDRIIGATALVHRLKLITADEKILKSGEVPCIW